MKSIAEPFIRRPVMTTLLAMAVAVFGAFCYTRLPVSDLPSVDYPVIQVYASLPGMDPSTMAANVATPLEKEFLKIQGLETVTSKNLQGTTGITLQFELEKNIDSAALDVQLAIQRAMHNLPSDMPSPPIFEKSNPNSQAIFYIAIASDTLPQGQLYDYASDHLAQKFNTVTGVSKTDVYGVKRAVRIEVDPNKLHTRGLTM
ncbi:MAG: efflux RND transporter permease subunit, partial [Puniceicoccales bacterium]|nr:efflux RND transporter permease subunit [Puniceicoccales bacterium]